MAAMAYWKTPSENMICGDVDGNIAWKAAALTPDRGGLWHGRLPVPGTGEYEWTGFRTDLPEEYNPERGWIATANHNIHPDGFSPPLMFKVPPYRRFERVADVLSDATRLSMDENIELQLDVRIERLDRSVAACERRVRDLTLKAQGCLRDHDHRTLVDILKVAEKLQHQVGKLVRIIERTEAKLLDLAKQLATQHAEVTADVARV